MNRRRFIMTATATAVTVAGCTSPEDDDDGTETGGGAYGKVDGGVRPASS